MIISVVPVQDLDVGFPSPTALVVIYMYYAGQRGFELIVLTLYTGRVLALK
jgi:hypothetical protein